MIKVGSKVKFNVDFLESEGFDELSKTQISFIHGNRDTIFVVERDWLDHIGKNFANNYRFELACNPLATVCFSAEELILVEEV